ncbi:MAG: hypothetical protein V4760_06140 [Bdellovibrionota bacterium]
MKLVFSTLAILLGAATAHAGSWHCEAGLTDTTSVVSIELQGDENGTMGPEAKVTVTRFPANYSARNDEPEASELARVIIGEHDPRSHMRLRIVTDMFDAKNQKAFVMLVNMPLKQELAGFCGYSN